MPEVLGRRVHYPRRAAGSCPRRVGGVVDLSESLGQAAEVTRKIAGRIVAILAILRQTLAHEELELHRHAGADRGERRDLLVDDLIEQRLIVLPLCCVQNCKIVVGFR